MHEASGDMPGAPATMTDVARAAGVSVMTVSNVVNGRSARVSAVTRARVQAVIDDLGYRVNLTARQLRQGRTGLVALAVPDFSSPYYGELASELTEQFAAVGLRLVMESTGGLRQSELDTLATSHLSAYDGLILSLTEGDGIDVEQRRPQAPIVLLGERATSATVAHVVMDNVGGARLAARHLLQTGCRTIALFGGASDRAAQSMSSLRTEGYLEAHREAGLDVDPRLIVELSGASARDGYEGVLRLQRAGTAFDSVLAVTDSVAIGALRALAESGIRVPEQVQVIGWDATDAGLFASPSLSSVDPNSRELASAVVRLLVGQIGADPGIRPSGDAAPQVVMPPASLALRRSTR